MLPPLQLKIKGGITLSLPASLECMSTFIALEQEDWFEDEIKFVRSFIQPGANVIDIGASYGFYALTMAERAGENGKVWAFEPADLPFSHLTESIRLNHFNNIYPEKFALTDTPGNVTMNIVKDSENNFLSSKNFTNKSSGEETVVSLSLDSAMLKYNWENIDFLKIDAEGEEINIFKGGQNFLERESPLIMFEIKHLDKKLLQEVLTKYSYNFYQLVPGLNILVPFDFKVSQEPFLLNLFCCKPDRANILEKQGFLLLNRQDNIEIPVNNDNYWLQRMEALKFSEELLSNWRNYLQNNSPSSFFYRRALNYFFLAHANQYQAVTRYNCLKMAHNQFYYMENLAGNICQQQTLVRIMADLGLRTGASKLIKIIIKQLIELPGIPLNEPFIPASPRFEQIEPQGRLLEWCISALMEKGEKLNYYSSFFAEQNPLFHLEGMKIMGFQGPEMERRRQLLNLKYKIWAKPELNNIITENSDNNLNADFWINY
jgi:FkbM family methyltransferase